MPSEVTEPSSGHFTGIHLISIIQAAGWPIWPLLAASVVALALVIERALALRDRVVAPAGLVDEVERFLREQNSE